MQKTLSHHEFSTVPTTETKHLEHLTLNREELLLLLIDKGEFDESIVERIVERYGATQQYTERDIINIGLRVNIERTKMQKALESLAEARKERLSDRSLRYLLLQIEQDLKTVVSYQNCRAKISVGVQGEGSTSIVMENGRKIHTIAEMSNGYCRIHDSDFPEKSIKRLTKAGYRVVNSFEITGNKG
jgi:hypothetical protein